MASKKPDVVAAVCRLFRQGERKNAIDLAVKNKVSSKKLPDELIAHARAIKVRLAD